MSRPSLYPALQTTNACNKNCSACLRSANTNDYKVTKPSFTRYLDDLVTASEQYRVPFQFVTGGEPTIWKDSDMNIKDILIKLSDLGFIDLITMPTNGKVFEDINYTRDFFKTVSSKLQKNMIVGVSIAGYQENLTENGYVALDNLISISKEPGMKFTPVIMLTLSSDDEIDKKVDKLYPGIMKRIVPLAPLGNASDMSEGVPSLCLAGNDKSGLGTYLPHFRKDVTEKLRISEDEFRDMRNDVIMNQLSFHCHCGNSPFIDTKWRFCLPFKDDARYDLCDVGEFSKDMISNFISTKPGIGSIRKQGVVNAVKNSREQLRPETKEKLDFLLSDRSSLSIAYRGCMVCKAFYDIGVLDDMNRAG